MSDQSKTPSIFSLHNSEHIPDTQGEVFYAIFPTTQSSIADTMFLIIINQLQFWSFRDKNK